LCVVEVKTRTRRDEFFTAEGAVNEEKRRALRRLANVYVRRLPTPPARKRMDVLSVYLEPNKPPAFQHFPGAIPWSN
jgi:Holliday junction resolvase-like predicted endonuclease